MSDIVERLRRHPDLSMATEAANEIERLRREYDLADNGRARALVSDPDCGLDALADQIAALITRYEFVEEPVHPKSDPYWAGKSVGYRRAIADVIQLLKGAGQ